MSIQKRDTVADWKAFQPERIPTKGGSLDKMPTIFLEALEQLEGKKREAVTAASINSNINSNINVQRESEKETLPLPKDSYLSILELGCGCGELSSSLQLRGHTVHGIDVNEGAVEKAKALDAKKLHIQQQRRVDRATEHENSDSCVHDFFSELGNATFEVADIATRTESSSSSFSSTSFEHYKMYDFCILQLLLSVVGGHGRRKKVLENAFDSLKGGGAIYLSCSGVSDSINPNYKALYEQDASELFEEHGEHSYFSRSSSKTENKNDATQILYITHHFTKGELESLLSDAGFGTIHIEQRKETSSRRPNEQAYFLYATAVATTR